jgi:hypothetical protein
LLLPQWRRLLWSALLILRRLNLMCRRKKKVEVVAPSARQRLNASVTQPLPRIVAVEGVPQHHKTTRKVANFKQLLNLGGRNIRASGPALTSARVKAKKTVVGTEVRVTSDK